MEIPIFAFWQMARLHDGGGVVQVAYSPSATSAVQSCSEQVLFSRALAEKARLHDGGGVVQVPLLAEGHARGPYGGSERLTMRFFSLCLQQVVTKGPPS